MTISTSHTERPLGRPKLFHKQITLRLTKEQILQLEDLQNPDEAFVDVVRYAIDRGLEQV